MSDPHELLREAWEKCGDIFSVPLLGLGDWTFVCSPELVKELFKSSEEDLPGGLANGTFLGYVLGSRSTFSLDGKAHDERRRLLTPHFNGRHPQNVVDLIRKTAEGVLAEYDSGDTFRVLESFNEMTLRIIIKIVFGDLERSKEDELVELVGEFFERAFRSKLIVAKALQWDLGPWSPWGKIMGLRRAVERKIEEEIDLRLGGEKQGGVLSALVDAHRTGSPPLDREDLAPEVSTLLFGAQESASKIMAWTIVGILSTPPVLERIRQELASAVEAEPITKDDLPDLPYLAATTLEGARFRPVGAMAGVRMAAKDTTLAGYSIPKGTVVTQCYAIMSQRQDIFETPNEFNPDHFHNRRFKPFEFNLFGGGKKMCLGKGLGEVEMIVIIGTMLQTLDLELVRSLVEPERQGFLLVPRDGALVRVKKRLR